MAGEKAVANIARNAPTATEAASVVAPESVTGSAARVNAVLANAVSARTASAAATSKAATSKAATSAAATSKAATSKAATSAAATSKVATSKVATSKVATSKVPAGKVPAGKVPAGKVPARAVNAATPLERAAGNVTVVSKAISPVEKRVEKIPSVARTNKGPIRAKLLVMDQVKLRRTEVMRKVVPEAMHRARAVNLVSRETPLSTKWVTSRPDVPATKRAAQAKSARRVVKDSRAIHQPNRVARPVECQVVEVLRAMPKCRYRPAWRTSRVAMPSTKNLLVARPIWRWNISSINSRILTRSCWIDWAGLRKT